MEHLDVGKLLRELTLEEKVQLLSGKNNWETTGIKRLGIPSLATTDGPHGVRGNAFFNGPKGMLVPSATAMGATFDTDLIYEVGQAIGVEAIERKCHVLLGPTVCLQRSPLIGRGFEAFTEDPWLSGMLAAAYIRGTQDQGVACSIKHYAAHDQSTASTEDQIVASVRTLREMHMMPFQLAVKHANPWSFMTAYNKINGTHASESAWLIGEVLRKEWGWDGLVMSDWFGTYSTTEAVEAGLDLEMPGPARWRGDLLKWAVVSRKLKEASVDACARNMLNLMNKICDSQAQRDTNRALFGDSQTKRDLCRQVAASSIVLLKNTAGLLPLDPLAKQTYGLIGPAVRYPAASGGGSADLRPYYVSSPLDAISSVVGSENVQYAPGCQSGLFLPYLTENVFVPKTDEPGYLLYWYSQDPQADEHAKPVATMTGTQSQMYFADNIPSGIGKTYWLKVMTTYRAQMSCTIELGLCVVGRGRMYVDGREVVNLYTSQPEKTMPTPMFDRASMEVRAEVVVEKGQSYEICVFLKNESIEAGAGALNRGGLRIGCQEKMNHASALAEAVKLAKQVDIPIVIVGLNSDYETEAADRTTLALPGHMEELIQKVLEANPKTSGCPITMPWLDQASSACHAWFGGQETGNGIADVLFGRVNPSGRISVTFPKALQDTPAYLNFGKSDYDIVYGEGVFLGYRYYEKVLRDPLFYFGYGLSYTTFEYANLCVPTTLDWTCGERTFDVSVDVRNSGDHDGYEVVQVYVSDPKSSVQRPTKELKGFKKVWIPSGCTETITLSLDKYGLSFWSERLDKWVAEAGTFVVILGKSANPTDEVGRAKVELRESFTWTGI